MLSGRPGTEEQGREGAASGPVPASARPHVPQDAHRNASGGEAVLASMSRIRKDKGEELAWLPLLASGKSQGSLSFPVINVR